MYFSLDINTHKFGGSLAWASVVVGCNPAAWSVQSDSVLCNFTSTKKIDLYVGRSICRRAHWFRWGEVDGAPCWHRSLLILIGWQGLDLSLFPIFSIFSWVTNIFPIVFSYTFCFSFFLWSCLYYVLWAKQESKLGHVEFCGCCG